MIVNMLIATDLHTVIEILCFIILNIQFDWVISQAMQESHITVF